MVVDKYGGMGWNMSSASVAQNDANFLGAIDFDEPTKRGFVNLYEFGSAAWSEAGDANVDLSV